MPQVIRLAAEEWQCPSPESGGFFESGGARGALMIHERNFIGKLSLAIALMNSVKLVLPLTVSAPGTARMEPSGFSSGLPAWKTAPVPGNTGPD